MKKKLSQKQLEIIRKMSKGMILEKSEFGCRIVDWYLGRRPSLNFDEIETTKLVDIIYDAYYNFQPFRKFELIRNDTFNALMQWGELFIWFRYSNYHNKWRLNKRMYRYYIKTGVIPYKGA